MATLDEYLAARAKCLDLAKRVRRFQRLMQAFLSNLREPRNVHIYLPETWMTLEEMAKIANDAPGVWNLMQAKYSELPEEISENVARPLQYLGLEFPINDLTKKDDWNSN